MPGEQKLTVVERRIMNRRFEASLTLSTCALVLLGATRSVACEGESTTVTNLPAIQGANFQVFGMNASGELTGFFSVFEQHSAEAFFYNNGNLINLGTLGGSTSEGHWINAAGQIVGSADLDDLSGSSHAFLVSNAGVLQDLGTLGGLSSTATAISDNGVVIGDSDLAGGGTGAFIITNGVMAAIGNLGSNYSSAFALNNNGLVVGQSGVVSGGTNAFAYLNGVLSNLGTLGADYSAAFAVNDAGEIVGESAVNSSDIHGFVYANGTMTDVGTLGGTSSSAFLLNSVGLAGGVATTAGDAELHGFVYSNGTITDLGTLGTGIISVPNAINSKGQIVGESFIDEATEHAFLWQNGNLTDLNTLLPPNSGWELMRALYLNEAGRVVGVGTHDGVSAWFIMDLAGASTNNPPIAVAGPDQTVDCDKQVNLDGSGSSDPENDPLTYEWSANGSVLGTMAKLSVALPIGKTVVTLRVTDPCGASSTATLTVTMADKVPPTGSCPAPLTVSADATCQAPVPNFVPQAIASDNCTPAGSLVITQTPGPGTLVGLGPHAVNITVTDLSGNSSGCSVLFTVVDTTPPAITGMPAPFTVPVGVDCQAIVPNVLGSVTAVDSCTPANLLVKSQNPPAGTLVGVGEYPLTVTVTDGAGNPAVSTVKFKVADTTAPIIQGPFARSVSTAANCQGSVPDMFDGFLVFSDNCTPKSQLVKTQTPAPGTKLSAGIYSVTVTVTDASGNTASAAVLLSVADNVAPVIQSLSVSPNVLSPPNHQIVPVTVSAVVTDNCDPAPVTKIVSISTNDGVSPGDIQITGNLTALLAANKTASGGNRIYMITVQTTDASSNSSSAQVSVTVPKSNGSSNGGI
jgi:probable HAF family extracellular repeat protein